MAQSNRYFRRSKLTEAKFRRLVRCFALDLTATRPASMTGFSIRSVNASVSGSRPFMVGSKPMNSPSGVVHLGYNKHFHVQHRENEFARQLNHINGIGSFWSLAKRRLARFCCVPKHTFYLHLKETEFRFNLHNHDLYILLLNFLRKAPL